VSASTFGPDFHQHFPPSKMQKVTRKLVDHYSCFQLFEVLSSISDCVVAFILCKIVHHYCFVVTVLKIALKSLVLA
jgi:hypothetical protein